MTRTEIPTITTLGLVALLAALVALLAWHEHPASAQVTTAAPGTTITVNTASDESNDDGDCSLREAIKAANTNAPVDACAAGRAGAQDAIYFSLGQGATIVLGKTLPAITDTSGLIISGGRSAKIVVSGDDKVGVFAVRKNAKLVLRNLTVADGFADGNNPSGDLGGGAKNNGGTLRVIRCTFSGNNALAVGGGIANISGGSLLVKNSTFAGNRAGSAGGAILNGGELRVAYSTFSGNDAELVGGGIQNANQRGVTLALRNTLLANSANGNINNVCAGEQCRGEILDRGYNISDDASFRFTAGTSRIRTDPKLDPDGLENNGGPTETIALRAVSPAINAIPKGTNGCGATTKIDQRGKDRPQGKRCDEGAFEKVLRR